MRPLGSRSIVSALIALAAGTSVAVAGPDWVEGGDGNADFLPDAGPLPGSAQVVSQNTSIFTISGGLAGPGVGAPPEGGFNTGDLEDMYLVRIDDFSQFSFSTELADGDAALGGNVCTSVYLFTGPDHPAGEGLGIVANFDPSGGGCGATITGFPDDGSTTPLLIDGLTYYIAIAADGRFPVDGEGQPIFDFFGSSMLGKTPTQVSGPDGPGGSNPIAGWDGFAFGIGGYIAPNITAVHGVPSNTGVRFEPPENNDVCVGPFGGQTIEILQDCTLVTGKLEKRYVQGAEPDTWLCVVDKFDNILASDDNGANGVGNGKGSGLWSGDADNDGHADILVDNGDGTYSLRLVVTGFPDGFDGNCNGFFQNAPHGQIGEFCVWIEYTDSSGSTIRHDSYTDEFITGAEAFRLNFTAPAGAVEVHINIDNTCGRDPICYDRDYMCFSGLEPLESYCVTVVGGLDKDCLPTDTQLCWFDKNCNVIGTDDNSGPAVGYSELCVIADVNGNICIGVSGGGDADCDGYICPPAAVVADGNCVPHGVCGTYTLKVAFNGTASNGGGSTCPQAEMAALGDVNMDGVVDAVDLAKLLSNWGAVTSAP